MDFGIIVLISLIAIFVLTLVGIMWLTAKAEKERKETDMITSKTRAKHITLTRAAAIILVGIVACLCIMLMTRDVSTFANSSDPTTTPETTVGVEETAEPETTDPITEPTEEVTEPPTEPETEPPTEPPTEPETTPVKSYYNVPLSEDLQDHIFAECAKYGTDPALVIAMIRKESNYHANSVGDSGNSLGLMQIQPRWHQGTMNRLNCPDLMDPYQNVTVGISIISGHLSAGKGEAYALMAYNMGSYYAKKNFDQGNISSYAKTVLKYKDALTWKE